VGGTRQDFRFRHPKFTVAGKQWEMDHTSNSKDLTNRWSQPLAVAMRMFDSMKAFLVLATFAPASGGSALSR
jgi:hypothetical protein